MYGELLKWPSKGPPLPPKKNQVRTGGGRSSSQTLAETGCTAPSSVEIVIKPSHCTHQAGRKTPLTTENTKIEENRFVKFYISLLTSGLNLSFSHLLIDLADSIVSESQLTGQYTNLCSNLKNLVV